MASETELELPPYEVIGPRGAPVVVALGGISATRHVCANAVDGRPGLVGADRRTKPCDRHHVVIRCSSFDFLDGGRGSDGRPERIVTTHDQADALAAVLDEIGVARVQAFVGASYGGMVALAFAERYPERVESLVVISAPDAPHPMSTAVRSVQRRIVELGLDNGCATDAAVARPCARDDDVPQRRRIRRAVRLAPLAHARRTTLCSRSRSTCAPRRALRCRVAPGAFPRALAVRRPAPRRRVAIRTPTLLVAAEGDAIVPRTQLEALAARLGASARLVDLPSTTGHDAFLTEPEALGTILRHALNASIFS